MRLSNIFCERIKSHHNKINSLLNPHGDKIIPITDTTQMMEIVFIPNKSFDFMNVKKKRGPIKSVKK